MIRKILFTATVFVAALIAVGAVLYVRNPPPAVPAISSLEIVEAGKPYVVKLHAQWCPICMFTKDRWSEIEATYSGRVRLVVFDFTDQATTDASRAEAKRLGLGKFFDDVVGETGTIAVLDGRTKNMTASIHGNRGFDEYRIAIDSNLRSVTR